MIGGRLFSKGTPKQVCGFCGRIWDPGPLKDCPICKSAKRRNVFHGRHIMCFECWSICTKVGKGDALTPQEIEVLARAPRLRFKVDKQYPNALASLLSQVPPTGSERPEEKT